MILRSGLAFVAGVGVSAAFEPVAVPSLAPLGVAVLVLAVRGTTARAALVPGLCFGIGFQFTVLWWMRAVGPDAWASLAGLEAAFYAPLGAALAVLGRLPGWPLWTASAWVAVETWRGGWPFGGMPFGRLAFATIDSPLAPAMPWLGAPGVSLAVALLGTVLAWLVVTARRRPVRSGAVALGAAALVALPTLAPFPFRPDGATRLAVVQGDVPGDGTDILLDHRQVTANHVDLTVDLAAEVAAGRRPAPDLVIWPENSTAVDPFRDAGVGAGIAEAVAAVDVPVLVGAIVDGPTEATVLNQGIVWDPEDGARDRYTKQHPVPFGEFIPWRDSVFTRPFGKLRLIPRDMLPGTREDPLPVAGVAVADSICFDVAYDDVVSSQVARGAELVVVQTSNAMFIRTAQVEQQFAITRLRALETGRYAVVAATNGVTGVIAPDGRVVERAPLRSPTVLSAQVGLSTALTPALAVGPWVARGSVAVSLAALALGLVAYRRQRPGVARAQRHREPAAEPVPAGSTGPGPGREP